MSPVVSRLQMLEHPLRLLSLWQLRRPAVAPPSYPHPPDMKVSSCVKPDMTRQTPTHLNAYVFCWNAECRHLILPEVFRYLGCLWDFCTRTNRIEASGISFEGLKTLEITGEKLNSNFSSQGYIG